MDSHFKRDFDSKEVYELHGSVETWQCAGDVETGAREPCEKIWMLPANFRFDLDVATMRAPDAEATTCPECGGKGRPNVLMFHDSQWIANTSEEVRCGLEYLLYATFAHVLGFCRTDTLHGNR